MINAIIMLIVWLVVIGILYALADYVISNLLPDPPQRIAKVVLVVFVALAVILLLLNMIGVGGIDLPKMG